MIGRHAVIFHAHFLHSLHHLGRQHIKFSGGPIEAAHRHQCTIDLNHQTKGFFLARFFSSCRFSRTFFINDLRNGIDMCVDQLRGFQSARMHHVRFFLAGVDIDTVLLHEGEAIFFDIVGNFRTLVSDERFVITELKILRLLRTQSTADVERHIGVTTRFTGSHRMSCASRHCDVLRCIVARFAGHHAASQRPANCCLITAHLQIARPALSTDGVAQQSDVRHGTNAIFTPIFPTWRGAPCMIHAGCKKFTPFRLVGPICRHDGNVRPLLHDR